MYPCIVLFTDTDMCHSAAPQYKLREKCPYSVRMRDNTDQKNSEYGHFSSIDSATWGKVRHQGKARQISFIGNISESTTIKLLGFGQYLVDPCR